MVFTYFSPSWFKGYDIFMEFSFFVVSFIITLFAYSIYKKTSNRSVMFFGMGFFFIAVSNALQTIINFLILEIFEKNANSLVISMSDFSMINFYEITSLFIHMIAMIIGLAFITYAVFKEKNTVYLILIMIFPLLGIVFGSNPLSLFYLFSTVFFAFICWHFLRNFLSKKDMNSLIVLVAFIMLFIANLHFILSVRYHIFYPIGHFLEFVAYLLILANFMRVKKK